ncbi:Dps family protein [Bacillus sp. Brlt_9]|uniref:Dps family protein n=1 Tax=Bacillus sp. Brlt_9 TaxID=3110916 RepID=UPI003F7C3E06
MTNKLHSFLNQEVSNFTVLYEKLHHYHWYVSGSGFFTLHEKFQADYEQITEFVDELAERLLMINGTPVSTLSEYLKLSTLTENQKSTTDAESMVKNLVSDYELIVKELKEGISIADELEDPVTEDLFIHITAELEKKIWMYKAYLSK